MPLANRLFAASPTKASRPPPPVATSRVPNAEMLLTEFRRITVLFISIDPGKANDQEEFDLGCLNDVTNAILEVRLRLEGTLRQIVMDDKGIVAILCFGLRPAHADDEHVITILQPNFRNASPISFPTILSQHFVRVSPMLMRRTYICYADVNLSSLSKTVPKRSSLLFLWHNCRARGVRAALDIKDRLDAFAARRTNPHVVRCHVGITTTPKVFCGFVGNATRSEYAVVGGAVNLAARLMSTAVKLQRKKKNEARGRSTSLARIFIAFLPSGVYG